MATIDLRAIVPHVTTVPWNTDRHSRLASQLKAFQFQEPSWHYGRKTNKYWIGAKETYLQVLRSSPLPLLILEDDATLLPDHYDPLLVFPDNADVVYLGGTLNAAKPRMLLQPPRMLAPKGHSKFRLMYAPFDDDYVRVFNMHSAHAILWVTERGRQVFVEAMQAFDRQFDVAFAMRMDRCLTLLRRRAYWYQQDGTNDNLTQFVL